MGEKRKTKQTARYYFTREIARAVAKKKLKDRRFTKICKKEHPCLSPKLMQQMGRLHHIPEGNHRSWFANHWRSIAMQGI